MIQTDYGLYRLEDGNLKIGMTPAVPIGGWFIRYMEQKRAGGISGNAFAYISSGTPNGASGIIITNSGLGQFTVLLPEITSSGEPFGNRFFVSERLDSGCRTVIATGYRAILPGGPYFSGNL